MGALRRALAKNPIDRYGNCGEFVDALEGKSAVLQIGAPMERKKISRQEEGGGDVFVRKLRAWKELDTAGQADATEEEWAKLGFIRELYAAGEEALRMGDRGAAGGLFSQVEVELAEWRKEIADRLEWERREEEIRQQREKEERDARERVRREVEAKRRAEEEKIERKRRENARMFLKAFWKVCVIAVLAGLVGITGVRACEMMQISRITAKLRAGDTHRAGETKIIILPGGAEMEMVWCPPGAFFMGSPPRLFKAEKGRDNDERQHRVTLTKGFWMATTEVTQAQWKSVMGSNPSNFKGDDLPVERVSWNDCREFCRKTGLRMPTEAEWEYACRAGSSTAYCWGNALNGDKANCNGNNPWGTKERGPYLEKTTPVRSYAPNAWGLFDMHGNVGEWCADIYQQKLGTRAVTDPKGPHIGALRVDRGGSWRHDAKTSRSANRGGYSPLDCSFDLGFRPAMTDSLQK